MKKTSILFIGISLLAASCRYSTCQESRIWLKYDGRGADKMAFNFKKYEKGSGFEKLLSTITDTARYKYSPYYGKEIFWAEPRSIDANNDYIIEIPATGKIYKIYDITYGGKKKAADDGLISENKTKCTRDISYKINGTEYHKKGVVYTYGNEPSDITTEILIEP